MLLALQTLVTYTRARLGSERGAAMVEYGLLVALIALVVAGAAFTLGGGISALFGRANTELARTPTP